jgi:Uncharacterized protein conserved in bacteria
LKVFLDDDDRFTAKYFDTKQVAIASGLIAVGAKNLIDEGKSFDEVGVQVETMIKHAVVYFCIPTLTYLRAGWPNQCCRFSRWRDVETSTYHQL